MNKLNAMILYIIFRYIKMFNYTLIVYLFKNRSFNIKNYKLSIHDNNCQKLDTYL